MEKKLDCGDFQADLNAYLAKHPNAPYHDLASIVASGLYLPYIEDEIRGAVAPPKADDRRTPCPDVYHDPPKIEFRNAVLKAMATDHLDAIVYPTWSNPPRKVETSPVPRAITARCSHPRPGFPRLVFPWASPTACCRRD
jgi:hypothetical protein